MHKGDVFAAKYPAYSPQRSSTPLICRVTSTRRVLVLDDEEDACRYGRRAQHWYVIACKQGIENVNRIQRLYLGCRLRAPMGYHHNATDINSIQHFPLAPPHHGTPSSPENGMRSWFSLDGSVYFFAFCEDPKYQNV